MILDSEEQRQVILQALITQPIHGDYQGIVEALPKYTTVVESVKAATVEGGDAGEQPKSE
jgi:hypothetical protein